MTNQHTPGPWFVTPDASAVYEKDELGYRADTICRLVGNPFATGNARLIATAPELLEALETLVQVYPNRDKEPGWVVRVEAAWAACEAAIAKVRGTQ